MLFRNAADAVGTYWELVGHNGVVRTFEVIGIILGPTLLACRFAGFTALRFITIHLPFGATVVGSKENFATPALPFEDKLHDPAPPDQ